MASSRNSSGSTSILEKWLEGVPNSNQSSVKKERKDFQDIFASFQSNSSLFPSSTTSRPQPSNSLNSHTNVQTQQNQKPYSTNAPKEEVDANAIDISSVKGIFGWEQVNDVPLPVILREDERLVPVRIVETKVIGKFSNSLPWTVFSCINIRSYYVTENEAKLLNEINSIHCDYYYGCEPFTAKDVVVCLPDVLTLYKFLETSKNVFRYGLCKSSVDWLGFVSISGQHIVPYICKAVNSVSGPQKYVPQSAIQHGVLLVKVEKSEMDEWDASYLRMLCIYAGLEHLHIASNDTLCLLSDLKWDSSLCPLHIEECNPAVTKLNNKMNVPKSEMPYGHHSIATSSQSRQTPQNSSMDDQNWLLASNAGSSDLALRSLHQVTKVDICGFILRAINVKPYSTQQAVFVSDVVSKMFRTISVLTAHYILEKILQVKLYECTRLHEDAFVRSGVRPLQGDKLVLVDVLRKCLPQLKQIIMAGITRGGAGINSPNLIPH
ncbi:uncharacterized protein B4U80_00602 [Leptotrombidium deliense]|uniref:Uncharacterized protein n=1 Tax=Leptotrombidium deliense TaxID=299467 RepID=A0A443SED2_9ACAR|nr:uncharacterized protein B4U80_00602 [Leptotrombidium deliense]